MPETDIIEAKSECETETCICQNTKPMGEWLKEETAECRPCLMGPVVDWYRTELEEQGRNDLAGELMKVVEEIQNTEEVVKVGEKMDSIKEVVGEGELQNRLKEFDCSVQMEAAILPPDEIEGLDNSLIL